MTTQNTLYLIYISGFLAALMLFFGIAFPLARLYARGQAGPRRDSVLSQPILSGLIGILVPMNAAQSLEDYCQRLERKLLQAGRPGGDISGPEYLATLELAGVGIASVVMLLLLPTEMFPFSVMLPVAILAGGAVVWLGLALLDDWIAKRRVQTTRQFPYFLDLAVMTMEAGSSFLETLEFYIKDNPQGALSEELRILLGEINLGKTMKEGLDNLKERVTAEDVQNTANALLQGQRMGTPLGQVLRNQADGMRFRRTQMAERAGEELKVKLQGPAMLMVVSVLLLVLGPALVKVTQGGLF